MYCSSAGFSGWCRLKDKSRNTSDIIVSTAFIFFNFRFEAGGEEFAAWPHPNIGCLPDVYIVYLYEFVLERVVQTASRNFTFCRPADFAVRTLSFQPQSWNGMADMSERLASGSYIQAPVIRRGGCIWCNNHAFSFFLSLYLHARWFS